MKQMMVGLVQEVGKKLVFAVLFYGLLWLMAKGIVREAWNMVKETYLWSNVRWL